jgi:two-component system, OmpR family, response regulator
MGASDSTPSSVQQAIDRPWTVVVLTEELAHGRRLVQALAHQDFRFVCGHPQSGECLGGAGATYDLALLYVAGAGAGGAMNGDILRAHRGCVVLLGHSATGMERARWIDNGADDCLNYPCDKDELLARLRASIRRRRSDVPPREPVMVGRLTIWPRERSARMGRRYLKLTTGEFSLLVALATHAGQVLARERLLEIAMGSAEQVFERAVDVQVSRLRAKLRDNPREPEMLKTVRGVGYVLVAPAPS